MKSLTHALLPSDLHNLSRLSIPDIAVILSFQFLSPLSFPIRPFASFSLMCYLEQNAITFLDLCRFALFDDDLCWVF